MIICPPMMLPAINGTTVYAEQLRKFFNARVLSTNALDWIAFHSPRGKTHAKGHDIKHLKRLKDPKTLSLARVNSDGLKNALINGPLSPSLFQELNSCNEELIYSLTLPFLNNYYAAWTSKKKVITPFYIKGVVKDHNNLLTKFNKVFACTEYEKKCIGLPNVSVSPMCVDPLPFMKASGKRFREKYGIEGRLVLFVGHANYEKGAYSILKACDKVNATFAFMGPHTRGFKQQTKGLKNVKLINPQLANKFDAFAACDCYCMPSRVEAFGITYLEAWACSKPVVAADTPVAREVISDCGLLVRFGEDPSQAIKDSIDSDLGIQGHKRLMKYFTEERVMNSLADNLNHI